MTVVETETETLPALFEEGEDRQLALTLVADLERSGAATPTSLSLTDPNMPFERYVALGRYFGHVKKALSWWTGDWLIFGEGTYGEKFAQAVDATGLSEDTLMTYVYVARNVAPSRRREDLDFGHHHAVAKFTPTEQTRWLKKAAKGGWTVADLRRELRDAKAADDGKQERAFADVTDRAAILEAVARAILRDAREDGDRVWIPTETFARLRAIYDPEA